MIARLLLALALFLAPPAFAQAVLTAADMRPSQNLDGAWHWSVDPFRDGKAGFHGGVPGESSRRWGDVVQAGAMEKNPRALYEFDMQRSPVVHLPGSWIGHAAEMRHYQAWSCTSGPSTRASPPRARAPSCASAPPTIPPTSI